MVFLVRESPEDAEEEEPVPVHRIGKPNRSELLRCLGAVFGSNPAPVRSIQMKPNTSGVHTGFQKEGVIGAGNAQDPVERFQKISAVNPFV
jgi:hypothetical protein